ncbi:MAG: cupredoxin domain-containing protein [Candidatus Thiodiazotropha sp.]
MKYYSAIFALALTLFLSLPAMAESEAYVIVIKNNRFEPSELVLPANQRIKLTIHNQDTTAEEFESKDLRREKIIAGNSTATVWVGPLPAGEYGFFGEFHEETAQGKLIAK